MSATGRAFPAPPSEQLQDAQRLVAAGAEARAALGRLTDLACRLLSTPASPVSVQVSLLTDVQTIAAGTGLSPGAVGSTGRLEDSLCTVTVATGGPLVVLDAPSDDRVAPLPPVTSGQVGAYLGVPLPGPGGAPIGALCAFGPDAREWSPYDVALLEELAGAVVAQLELHSLAQELASTRLRWDVALEAAGIGSFDLDLATGELDWDLRMQELFGYAPGEFRADLAAGLERVHPGDRPDVEAAIADAVSAVGAYRAEFRLRLPDGRQRWLAARGRAVPGPDGRAARLLGTAYDITELRTARDEAARLLETMTTGFLAVDRAWTVTYLNTEGARVLGHRADELVGRDLWEAFPGLRESEFGRQYERAVETGQAVEVEAYYERLARWFSVRAMPSSDGLALYFLEVTGRHHDQEHAARANARLELLARVSAELVDAGFDVEGAVARLVRVLVPDLADWALISFTEGDAVRDVAHWHRDPELRGLADTYVEHRLTGRTDLGAVDRARRTMEPVVVPSGLAAQVVPTLGDERARQALTALAVESAVVVPLVARGHMIGVLTLVRGVERPAATPDEIATAREIAARAALALDNAHLFAEQRGLAEGLQRSLLTTPREPDHCEIAVRYVPAARAAQVGGDWYDAFLQRDGATVLVIGDVMGHDTDAAASMGQLRGLARGIAWHSGGTPAQILRSLDDAMQGLQLETTATAVVARLEQTDEDRAAGLRRLRWSNAGHLPPLVLRPDGSVDVLAGDAPDLLLGLDPSSERTDATVVLPPGSTVLLLTDGLVERRGQDLDHGLERLREVLSSAADRPLQQLCDELLGRLLPADADDDVALVAVRLRDEAGPSPAG